VTSKSGMPVLQAVAFGLVAEVQRFGAGIVEGVSTVWSGYIDLRGLRNENERLRHELAEARILLQQERALASRSEQLEALLDLKSAAALETAAAEVIAAAATPEFRTITLDRGTGAGLRPDMAVIAPGGVVGRVLVASARAAKVQLLIDRNAAAGALTERTRAGGLVVGSEGDPPLRMELVSNLADVRPGDLVVASGIDGIYPKGFAIGYVEGTERGAGMYRSILVRPAVDFSSLEDVLVVLVPPRPATPEEPPAESGEGAQ